MKNNEGSNPEETVETKTKFDKSKNNENPPESNHKDTISVRERKPTNLPPSLPNPQLRTSYSKSNYQLS